MSYSLRNGKLEACAITVQIVAILCFNGANGEFRLLVTVYKAQWRQKNTAY